MIKPRQYHQSEINMFLKCGKQWEFRYLLGIRTPPRGAMTVGSSVDAGVTRNLTQKVASKTDMPIGDVLDVYSTDFDIRAKETDFEGEDSGTFKDVGAQLLKAHHEVLAPAIQPAKVQEKFVIETDAGYNIGGTIDLVEADDTVADTKTAKTKYGEDSISRAIQPAVYDFAFEALNQRKSPGFRYDVLIKPTKTIGARTQQVKAQVTEADREFLFDTISNMDKAIKAGVVLPAAEGSWWCSKDWCGYWGRCKGKTVKK